MKRRRFLAVASVGAGGSLAGRLGSDGERAAGDSFRAHLDQRVPELLDRYDVPGASVALVRDGEPAWSAAYGDADREGGRPTTVDTVFRAASITKSITAWGVMTLVERGEVGLEDPIERHVTRWELPAAEFDTDEVTVRRLLSHTSGLQMELLPDDERYAPGEALPTPEEVLAGEWRGSAARFERPPGSEFSYSNAGFALLELLIEQVTGRDYAEHVEAEILSPLGMDDSTFAHEAVRSKLATGYLLDGDRGPVFVDPVKAPGGLYATAADLARFVAAGAEGPDGEPPGRGILAPESVVEIHTPVVETSGLYGFVADAYGLGHFVETLPGGQRAVWHGGQHTGWLSHYHCVPESGDGIVVLTNSERAQRFLADVVGAWAERRGLSSVAMSRTYSRLATGARASVGVAGLAAAWLAWRLGRDLRAGERRFDPLARRAAWQRAGLAGLAVLLAGLWWGLGRSVLTPLLPVLSDWLAVALSAFAALALLTVLLPRMNGDE